MKNGKVEVTRNEIEVIINKVEVNTIIDMSE